MEEEDPHLAKKRGLDNSNPMQIYVPAFGNCFFISIVLAYLLPALPDIPEFERRLDKLAELSSEEKNQLREDLLLKYNNITYLKTDILFDAVIEIFKLRLNISTWGGSEEDLQKASAFLEITIVELNELGEDIEIPNSPDINDQNTQRIFILRCKPIEKEFSSEEDDPELQLAKLDSAHHSGDQRHFRVIDVNNRIYDAIDMAQTDFALADHTRTSKKPKTTVAIPEIPESPPIATEKETSLKLSDAIDIITARLNTYLTEFVKTNIEGKEDLSGIDWAPLIETVKINFETRGACLHCYLSQQTEGTSPELFEKPSEKNYALYYQLVFQGALFALHEKLDIALQKLKQAITVPFYGTFKLAHLWILDIYFRQGNFQAVIAHLTYYSLGEKKPDSYYVSALYPFFTQLGAKTIHRFFLQFTHVFGYPYAEFDFFWEEAHQRLGMPSTQKNNSYFFHRADTCLVQNQFSEAIRNYDIFPEHSDALFRKAFCLLMLGQLESAKPLFEAAVEKANSPSKKNTIFNFLYRYLLENSRKKHVAFFTR